MKTFRMIGMALMAVLMCVNFTSCSEDDDPTGVKNENGIDVGGKKLVKIVDKSEDGYYSETYTFSYDDKGRLVFATVMEEEGNYSSIESFDFIWGGDVIKVISTYPSSNSTSMLSQFLYFIIFIFIPIY